MKRRRSGLRSPRFHAIATVLVAGALTVGVLREAPTWAQDSTPSGSPEASPTVTITPEPNAPRLELPFEVLNDSGLSGTATLYEAGDKTIVDLDVKNTGDDQPAHIHAGTCGNLEAEPAFDLTALHADGKSRTVIDTPLEGLLNGQFAIDIHLSPTELGTLSACANIAGTPTVPSGSPTPENGTPAATVSPVPTGQGGEVTTPTATTPATVAPTTAATTPASTVAPTATATATTATSGTTGSNGDGTGGDTSGTSGSTTTTTTTTSGSSSASTTTTTTSGDGTGTGGTTSNGSTYIASDGTVQTAAMAASGVGPLGIVPEGTDPAIVWSIVSAAVLLFMAGIWIWIGERRSSHRQPPRWSRLGM